MDFRSLKSSSLLSLSVKFPPMKENARPRLPHKNQSISIVPQSTNSFKKQFNFNINSNFRRLSHKLPSLKTPSKGWSSVEISASSKSGKSRGRTKNFNQDTYVIKYNIRNYSHCVGVFDGHGKSGHLVSKFLSNTLFSNMSRNPKIEQAFILANNELSLKTMLDSTRSGSTATVVLLNDRECLCANVGDSRAILGKLNDSQWDYEELTVDHKPSLEEERDRIHSFGGKIEPQVLLTGQTVGPERVWLPNKPCHGLTMTRAFGNKLLSKIGVNCVPHVETVSLNDNSKFIVVASDGVWDVLSNDEVCKIVAFCYGQNLHPSEACEKVVKQARRRWKMMSGSIDDVTAVVVFLYY